MTLQESHRQFERLANAGLVKKDSEGFLYLCPYGKMIVIQLSSFHFLQKHKEYFNEHTLDGFPTKFVKRIGDLNNSEFVEGSYVNNERWKSIASEAQQYLRIISAQVPPDAFKLAVSMSKMRIKISLIHGENTIVPKEFKELMASSELGLELRNLSSQGLYERKMVKRVQVMMILNEKKGIVLFPNLKGKVDIDYAFFSDDSQFHEWCSDYFDYVWNSAGDYDISKLQEF
jgi:predicted transcriptional regulator